MFTLNSPLKWTRQECSHKRRELEKLRDDRAEILGELTELRQSIDALLSLDMDQHSLNDEQAWIVMQISNFLLRTDTAKEVSSMSGEILLPMLMDNLASKSINSINALHLVQLKDLSRPTRLVLLWPKLVFLPPALLWLSRYLYASRESIWQTMSDVQETLTGFWNGWVVGPVKEIFNTVRTGGDEGMSIVSKDSLNADMEVAPPFEFTSSTSLSNIRAVSRKDDAFAQC